MFTNFPHNANTVFLVLGRECNMHCKYCLQHDVYNQIMARKVNPDLYNFIRIVSGNHPMTLQFFGGEPLIFWDNIKQTVENLKSNKNIRFSVITNGKALTPDKVEFINEYFSNITISWDGRNSIYTRGYDIFKENKENIFKLKRFNISGVLSSYNYVQDYLEDAEQLNADLNDNYNGDYTISVNIDDLLEIGVLPDDMKNFDYDKLYNQATNICQEYFDYFTQNKPISLIKKRYVEQKIAQITQAIKTNHIAPTRDRCSNGYEVLNLDLDGNLYKCHNICEIIGNIHDDYYAYIKKVLALDKTEQNAPICNQCPVQMLCKNGCPLVNQKSRQEFYCKAINVLNVPFLDLIKEMGDSVADLQKEENKEQQ